ncbi:MAG: hypothetical protein ACTSRL_03140 [Candidatus Helarchaeota archaeon]
MGLFGKSKKKTKYKDYEVTEDYYEEDPWYSMDIKKKKSKKKHEHADDSWDGMDF